MRLTESLFNSGGKSRMLVSWKGDLIVWGEEDEVGVVDTCFGLADAIGGYSVSGKGLEEASCDDSEVRRFLRGGLMGRVSERGVDAFSSSAAVLFLELMVIERQCSQVI